MKNEPLEEIVGPALQRWAETGEPSAELIRLIKTRLGKEGPIKVSHEAPHVAKEQREGASRYGPFWNVAAVWGSLASAAVVLFLAFGQAAFLKGISEAWRATGGDSLNSGSWIHLLAFGLVGFAITGLLAAGWIKWRDRGQATPSPSKPQVLEVLNTWGQQYNWMSPWAIASYFGAAAAVLFLLGEFVLVEMRESLRTGAFMVLGLGAIVVHTLTGR